MQAHLPEFTVWFLWNIWYMLDVFGVSILIDPESRATHHSTGASWGGWEFVISGSGTSWTYWAMCQFGASYQQSDSFTARFACKAWSSFKHYNATVRWGLSQMLLWRRSSTWAPLICLDCTYCSRFTSLGILWAPSEGVCFWRKVFYWKVFNMETKHHYLERNKDRN